MTLPKKYDFNDYDNYITDPNPTTSAEAQDYFRNTDSLVGALVDTFLWQPNTTYAKGDVVKSPSMPSNVEAVCVNDTNGKSSNVEPSWGNVGGGNVSDGTCFWELRMQGTVTSVNGAKPNVNGEVTVPTMQGATTTANGASGLVPAPSAGAKNRYLNAYGDFDEIDVPVQSVNGQTGDVVIPEPNYPVTSVNGMTGDVDITKLFPVWHLDFGDGSDGVFSPSSNVTISGTKNYTSINIPSGVTVTVDKSAYIKCKGDVVINGTIKAVGANGGAPTSSGSNAGNSGYFAVGGTGGKANSGKPGAGGGALELKSGVAGVTAVMNYLHSENIITATIYSAGGGAGDWEQQHRGTPGTGGNGGGGVLIICKNFTNNGTIDASGSKGGDGGSPYGASGGGGGGGLVYIVCDKNNKTGTINTQGGAGGTGQSNWGTGSNGATGGEGVTYIKARG